MFACELSQNSEMIKHFVLYNVRIEGPDGEIYYVAPITTEDKSNPFLGEDPRISGDYQDESAYPLIIDSPKFSIQGKAVIVEWKTLQEHITNFDNFTIQALNEEGIYEDILCANFAFIEGPIEGTYSCEVTQLALMSDDFNLEYGE